MTAILTVLGALGVLRTCRRRHDTYRFARCTLTYQHSGRCEFGQLRVAGLDATGDLDAAPGEQRDT